MLRSAHVDAAALVDRSIGDDPVGEMYDRYVELLDRRPRAHRIAVVRGDVDGAVAAVESVLG